MSSFQTPAFISPVDMGGLASIDRAFTATLVTPVSLDAVVRLEVPRDSLRTGLYFTARYLTEDGASAKRAVMQAVEVEPRPRMRDVVTVRLLAEPVDAPIRATPRTAADVPLAAAGIEGGPAGGRPFALRMVDVSEGGIGLHSDVPLKEGDRINVSAPQHGAPQPASIEIVTAVRAPIYGARFEDPEAGRSFHANVVDAVKLQRSDARERQAGAEAPRPGDGARHAPGPTAVPAPAPRQGGMRSRD